MPHKLTPEVRHWVEQTVGSGAWLQSVQVMTAATSSAVYSLTISHNQRPLELVLRLFTNQEWLAAEPDLARHEVECLRLARELDVVVPEVVAVDEDGRFTHHPAVLMTKLPGQAQLAPQNLRGWLEQLAATLIKIHTLPANQFAWQYKSWINLENLHLPAWAQRPKVWQKAFDIIAQPAPNEPKMFIHRDYHPMNVLWQGPTLSGVVDWVNGCRGPISEDISHCRGNLYKMYSIEAADHFLATYQALSPPTFAYNPYWDVATVMNMEPSADPFDYPPWQSFGLKLAPTAVLQQRLELFLETAVRQFVEIN